MTVVPQSRLIRYLTVALRWLLILTGVFFASFAAGRYAVDHFLPQVYTATATIQVPPGDLFVPSAGARPVPVAFNPEFENVMRSPDCLLSVIKDLGLDKIWAKRIYQLNGDDVPDVDALTNMEKVLKFRADSSTSTVAITASSDVPQEAADIANAVADRYKVMRAVGEDKQLAPQPVNVIARAVIPTAPTHPNTAVAFVAIVSVSSILSLIAASFVEIILLFLRAGERADN